MPTIEMATKIANALKISLDYLVIKTELQLDNSMLECAEAVTKMIEKGKDIFFILLDAFIAKSQF